MPAAIQIYSVLVYIFKIYLFKVFLTSCTHNPKGIYRTVINQPRVQAPFRVTGVRWLTTK